MLGNARKRRPHVEESDERGKDCRGLPGGAFEVFECAAGGPVDLNDVVREPSPLDKSLLDGRGGTSNSAGDRRGEGGGKGFVNGIFRPSGRMAPGAAMSPPGQLTSVLGRKTMLVSLNEEAGTRPLHASRRMPWSVVAPRSPHASQDAYGRPSGPGAEFLALRRNLVMHSLEGRTRFAVVKSIP